jgi:cell division protein FtsQ
VSRAADVVALYNEARTLFGPTGRHVDTVVLDARGSWRLRLADGTEVVVGRSDARPRLARFARVLPGLMADEARPLVRADLRYTNGFALVWGEPVDAGDAPAPGSAAQPSGAPASTRGTA